MESGSYGLHMDHHEEKLRIGDSLGVLGLEGHRMDENAEKIVAVSVGIIDG